MSDFLAGISNLRPFQTDPFKADLFKTAQGSEAVVEGGQTGFGDMLSKAVEQVQRSEIEANDAVTKLAMGEDIELHQVMLKMQEADIAFQVASQMRNKIVEAYQEVMRMQL